MFLRYQQVGRLLKLIKPKTIVEVGTWNGDHALIMAAAALKYHKHIHYWGFDLFEQATDETDAHELNVRTHHARDAVAEKLRRFAADNPGFTFDLFDGNSLETLPAHVDTVWIDPEGSAEHRPASADFAYIDGGHAVETIASDYAALSGCGAILFDDYYEQDSLGRAPDTKVFGCNQLLASMDHVVLPAKDDMPAGGAIRMAAAGPAILNLLGRETEIETTNPVKSKAVVTTFSTQGYYEYGARFIETFDQFWPADVPLYVYLDEMLPVQTGGRVHAVNFPRACPDLVAFKARHMNNPAAHGQTVTPEDSYRFDAVKFCHKVFALTHCAETCGADELIWVDADSVTFEQVTHYFLESLLPPGAFTSYLGRRHTHSECGFMMFDLRHEMAADFMTFFKNLYAEDLVFELPEWHDSYVYDVVRGTYESKGLITSLDLRAGHEDDHHPFINSPLGAVLDHLIGPRRKLAGCSFAGDLKTPRDEFYWNVVPLLPEDLISAMAAKSANAGDKG